MTNYSEEERLSELASYRVIDENIREDLNGLTELASGICETPISMINLLDSKYQVTKSNQGWDIEKMPRESGFCRHTVRDNNLMVVENALEDERFRDNPYVKDYPNIRFYAGMPLKTAKGFMLGSLCVIDNKPRQLSESQKDSLELLAEEAIARLELIKSKKKLELRNRELEKSEVFISNSSDIQAIIDPESRHILEINKKAPNLLGGDVEDFVHQPFGNRITDKTLQTKIHSFLGQQNEKHKSFIAPVRDTSGNIFYFDHAFTLHNSKWYMTARNITEREEARKQLQHEKDLSNKIVNSLPGTFFMYDENRNAVRWNDKMMEVTGFDEQQIAYSDPLDYFPDDHKKRVDEKVKEVFTKGEATLEADLLNKDGRRIPYLFNASLFQNNEDTFLIGTGLNISEIREYQNKLSESLKEKEVLLSEIHHRVKNNLAVISGLLHIESFKTDNDYAQKALQNSQLRIQSIATVHEILYKADNFSNLPFDDFISAIIGSIKEFYDETSHPVTFNIDIEEVSLNVNQAIPCALIINELINNAYEHAFKKGENGIITIILTKSGENITLYIHDNGRGMPENFSIGNTPTTGYTLVKTLVQQLEADIRINSDDGTKISIAFEKKNKKGSGSSLSI